MHLIYVALGGSLGALARYLLAGWVVRNIGHALPMGTLVVNVLGAFLMGACFVLILEKAQWPPELRQLLMVGFLGAFTTFSTFSLEVVALLQEGHIMSAAIYILLSVLCCTVALAAGIWLLRTLL